MGILPALAAALALLGAVGVGLAMALPLHTTVTYINRAAIPKPVESRIDVDCGPPIRNGPGDVIIGAAWMVEPCAEPIRRRRIMAGISGMVFVVAGVGAVALARRRRSSS